MREINFRALWTDGYCEPKWVYGYLTERDGNILIDPGGEEDAFIIITKHENSVGQYTGLKDKNGKEVYEGDIVNCSMGCPHEVYFEDEYGGTYVGGMPAFYLKGLLTGYAWTGSEEIIGNIYDNPEMLEV